MSICRRPNRSGRSMSLHVLDADPAVEQVIDAGQDLDGEPGIRRHSGHPAQERGARAGNRHHHRGDVRSSRQTRPDRQMSRSRGPRRSVDAGCAGRRPAGPTGYHREVGSLCIDLISCRPPEPAPITSTGCPRWAPPTSAERLPDRPHHRPPPGHHDNRAEGGDQRHRPRQRME